MADVNEKQIYAALGIDYPDAGASEQDLADPAQESREGADGGENGQEVAEPAQAQEPAPEDGAGEEGDQNTGNPEMDAKTRHENAARRRQQEQQAAINKAVEEALEAERQRNAQQLESIFTRAGLRNTITGAPIKNEADFNAWEEAYSRQRIENELGAGQLTPELLDQAISQHPAVKQAQMLIQRAQLQEQQMAERAAQQRVDAELAEIRKTDPSIQSVDDLLAGEHGSQILALTQKGLSLPQAYYLVTREGRERAIAEAARQQAALLARGKEHLRPNGSSAGTGAVSVPQDEMRLYRLLMPNAPESEFQAHYNKHLKKN